MTWVCQRKVKLAKTAITVTTCCSRSITSKLTKKSDYRPLHTTHRMLSYTCLMSSTVCTVSHLDFQLFKEDIEGLGQLGEGWCGPHTVHGLNTGTHTRDYNTARPQHCNTHTHDYNTARPQHCNIHTRMTTTLHDLNTVTNTRMTTTLHASTL